LKEFITAAKSEDEVEEGFTFKHNGREVTFYRPSDGQQTMMLAMGGRGMSPEAVGTFIHLWINLGDDDTQRYFQDLLLDRKSGFDINSKGGMFDIWEWLTEEWSGKDSQKPSASRASRRATGVKSTATTPAKALTSSRSRTRAS
jgi:hypothetical protein